MARCGTSAGCDNVPEAGSRVLAGLARSRDGGMEGLWT
jgi:hypothetical protein